MVGVRWRLRLLRSLRSVWLLLGWRGLWGHVVGRVVGHCCRRGRVSLLPMYGGGCVCVWFCVRFLMTSPFCA